MATKADWSHPGSQLILPAEAPEHLWLAERKKGLGGSDLSAILGMNDYSSAYHVWLEKTDRWPAGHIVEESAPMRWGKLHEPTLKQAFTEDTGIKVRTTGLHRSKAAGLEFMQVTPDGFTEDGGVFESKCGSIWQAKHWEDDELSDHAHLQVMHCQAVTGRRHAWVVVLLGNSDFRIRRVDWDQDMVEELVEFERDWWERHIVRDTPPPVTDVAMEAIKERWRTGKGTLVVEDPEVVTQLLKDLQAKKDELKKVEIQAKVIEAQLREIAAENEEVTDGETPLFTIRNDGTFASTRFTSMLTEDELKECLTPKPVLDMDIVKKKFPAQYNACRARVIRSKVK